MYGVYLRVSTRRQLGLLSLHRASQPKFLHVYQAHQNLLPECVRKVVGILHEIAKKVMKCDPLNLVVIDGPPHVCCRFADQILAFGWMNSRDKSHFLICLSFVH